MSHTPTSNHFVSNPDLDLLTSSPHKSLPRFFQAILATALFRIWPTLLFFGGWATMVVCINRYTSAQLSFPATMITVLGVLLGLTLSYRTSSAYDRYYEGRRLWSQIILASRNWSRMVWIHCPDTLQAVPIEEEAAKALDETRAVMEKGTMVQMALAFAVAVKHYLRGEEGIFYEDLFHLVRFIPSLHLPSGIPSGNEAYIASNPTRRQVHQQGSVSSAHRLHVSQNTTEEPHDMEKGDSEDGHDHRNQIPLNPAANPPKFRWAEIFPFKYLVTPQRRQAAAGRQAMKRKMKEAREGGGVGQNVPLEINMFMSAWVAQMQKRKTIDVPTINALLLAMQSMGEALSSLERILTTPIPWSYNAHIWEVTWVYVLLLPFQLWGAGFGWLTIPGTVIVAYIVIGFAEIGEEIENPFGYDKNDLNLDFFVQNIIAQELAAIVARPFDPPEVWVFSAFNQNFGITGVGAEELQHAGVDRVRRGLAGLAISRFRNGETSSMA